MVPTLAFDAFVLVALVWLFLLLYWLGPNNPTTRSPLCRNAAPHVVTCV